VIVAITLLVLANLSQKHKIETKSYLYRKTEDLLSPAERSFLGVLHQEVGGNQTIFGKVKVADIVEPRTGLKNTIWTLWKMIFLVSS
jgi:hypothetical protein